MAWPGFVRWPPSDVRDLRLRQVAYLARYGRQSMLQWDDVDLEEFQDLFRALGGIIVEEGAMSRGLEDG